ncbi:MAG: serine/threonine-protein phosphatase [Verrucomicrobia bacterium]|nr:serine/threonine-protein phosphatase [Verrucomicrobiota bacterium]MCH8512916.1 protein phosphatase 2C domain-containing protein [Kiritimatiellia bacterium]
MDGTITKEGLVPEKFRVFSRTDVGKRRKRNEDSLGVIARHGIFVVADGMGGVDGGDFSSRKVVEMIATAFENLDPTQLSYAEKLDLLEETVNLSSAEIHKEAGIRGICGMGTTVVLMCFDTVTLREACIMHVGDSRVYLFRNRDLHALTTDHSMAAESGLSDSAMIPIFMAGVITRAVGVRDTVAVDRTPVSVRRGDKYVICSDGLYNMVRRPQMCSILQHDPIEPATELVNAANDAGGFDNITVILVEVLQGEDLDNASQMADTKP